MHFAGVTIWLLQGIYELRQNALVRRSATGVRDLRVY
jgi:hypothetical protein